MLMLWRPVDRDTDLGYNRDFRIGTMNMVSIIPKLTKFCRFYNTDLLLDHNVSNLCNTFDMRRSKKRKIRNFTMIGSLVLFLLLERLVLL